jgi:hypothetical protein
MTRSTVTSKPFYLVLKFADKTKSLPVMDHMNGAPLGRLTGLTRRIYT